MTHSRTNQGILWLVVVGLFLGMALRIIGISWGLPYQLHPDEPVLFINAWERWNTGEASIKSYYPPLYIYGLMAEREFIYRVFGAETPQVVYFFFGRWTTILVSMLLLAVAFRLGKEVGGWRAGFVLLLLMGLDPDMIAEQGWLIKADSLAYLLAFCTFALSWRAYQRRSWRYWGLALVLVGLATLAKFNMALVFVAPLWVALVMRFKRPLMTTLVMLLATSLVIFIVWQTIYLTWVDYIEPSFGHCAAGSSAERSIEWLPCSPMLTFQLYLADFYQRHQFIDEINRAWLQNQGRGMVDYIGLSSVLVVGGGLALGIRHQTLRRRWPSIALFGAVAGVNFLIFAIMGVPHPIRQYFVVILGAYVVMAIIIGNIKQPGLYALATILLIVPNLLNAIEVRRDFLKPDTRVLTAEFFLGYARQGEAIIVEYDSVEFAQQYGGFPRPEGYFNILRTDGVYDFDVDNLFEQGIYYVVADERARFRPTGYTNNQAAFTRESFALLEQFTGDNFYGPDRWLYRTFAPQTLNRANFGDVVRLEGYDLTQTEAALDIRFYWHAQQTDLPDYSLFVHLIDTATGEQIGGFDAPPERATHFWDQYEWVFDDRSLPIGDLPTGDYALHIGWYNPLDGARLPVNGDGGGSLRLLMFSVLGD